MNGSDVVAELTLQRARERERQGNATIDALPLEPWILLLAKKIGARVVESWLEVDGFDPDDPDYDEFAHTYERRELQGFLLQVAKMAIGAVESMERKAGEVPPDIDPETHSARVINLVTEHVETSLPVLDLNLPQRICRLIRAVGVFSDGEKADGIQVAAEAVSIVLAMDRGDV